MQDTQGKGCTEYKMCCITLEIQLYTGIANTALHRHCLAAAAAAAAAAASCSLGKQRVQAHRQEHVLWLMHHPG